MSDQGFAKLNRTGLFRSKRAEKIKIIFKDNNSPFDLKNIWILPDNGCGKYEKLRVKKSSALRKARMRPIYNFLQNLDAVINDITAKEPKPWLDFTIDNFFPQYVVDYGNIDSIDNTRAGLECLLENQLGIGNGQVIDSLVREIMSAFNSYEREMAEEICRAIKEDREPLSPTQAAAQRDAERYDPKAEREVAMKAKYEKEFENKCRSSMVDYLNNYWNSIFEGSAALEEEEKTKPVNSKNLFDKMREYGVGSIPVKYPSPFDFEVEISSEEQIKENAKYYAQAKFEDMETGSFGDQIQNSPHYHEALEASREVFKRPENTFVQGFKDSWESRGELDILGTISVFGICGMTKTAGKALECLAGGVSFDRFLGILIDKTFDFMEINTLSLFMNGLPADFREALNEEMERQFGNISLSDLFELKKAENPNQKLKDFIVSKQVAKNILDIYKTKWIDGGVSTFRNSLSEEDRELIDNAIGPFTGGGTLGFGPWNKIYDAMIDMGWDPQSKSFLRSEDEDGNVYRRKPGSESEERNKIQPEKFVLSLIKYLKREHTKSQNSFRQAMNRMKSGLGSAIDNVQAAASTFKRDRDNLRDAIEEQEKLVDAERESLKNIMTDEVFNDEGLVQNLTTAVLTPEEKASLMKESAKRLGTYRAALLDLEGQLDGLAKDRAREELKELRDRIDFLVDEGSIGEGLLAMEDLLERSKQGAKEALQSIKETVSSAIDETFITADEPEELDRFAQSMNSFKETALGVKVDAVFDVIIDYSIDYTLDYFGLDDLLARLQNYPIVDFVSGLIDKYIDSCEAPPIIYPPPGDFLKGLSVDICDPTVSLTLPKINIPSINLRFLLEAQFSEIFREAIIKIVSEIVINILKKLLFSLEGSLCNLLESVGGFSADALRNRFDDLENSFYNALNEAFCNDGENPESAEKRAKELADALFSPILFDAGMNYEGSGANAANVISSVASTEDFLGAMVAKEGEEDDQFCNRVANAVNALTPEMSVLLGDPNQVAYFFRNLGSYLTPEDRGRIRDLLAAGIPNLPLSPALCLTNDQLNKWNDLRSQLLRGQGVAPDTAGTGATPGTGGTGTGGTGAGGIGAGGTGRTIPEIVDDLNNKTADALEDLFDVVGDLNADGPFLGSITNEMMKDVCNPDNVVNPESQSQFDRDQENELTEAFFDNIQRSLANGFFTQGGILSEALKDKEGRIEIFRGFFKRFNGNYTNSQAERDSKYGQKRPFGQFLMDLNTQGGLAIGVYPDTVAILQRNQIVEETAQNFKFNNDGKNVTEYSFSDSSDDFEYQLTVRANNSINPKDSFDYRLRVDENTYEGLAATTSLIRFWTSKSQYQSLLRRETSLHHKDFKSQPIKKRILGSSCLQRLYKTKSQFLSHWLEIFMKKCMHL